MQYDISKKISGLKKKSDKAQVWIHNLIICADILYFKMFNQLDKTRLNIPNAMFLDEKKKTANISQPKDDLN